MKKLAYCAALFLLGAGGVHAETSTSQKIDPPSFSKTLFPPVEESLSTPGAIEKRFADYNEIKPWLDQYAKVDGVRLTNLGKTPDGNDIWSVHLTNPKAKLRMMVTARVHGNEPASSDAALQFIHALIKGELKQYRENVSFLIVPIGNPDGSIRNKRQTSSGGDINRDYTTNNLVETRILSRVIQEFDPHILVDLHEYTVWGRLGNKSSAYDLYIGTINEPNLPHALAKHQVAFVDAIKGALVAKGMRGSIYELLDMKKDKLEVAESATTFVSGKNFMAMPSRLSFLFEGRGIGLGNQNFERRVSSLYTGVRAILQTAHSHADETLALLDQAQHDILRSDQWELARKPKKEERNYPLVSADTAAISDEPASFINRTDGTPTAFVDVPFAYIIPANRQDLIEKLAYLGIAAQPLKSSLTLDVDVQVIDTVSPDGELFKGFPKQKVTTSVKADKRSFAKGDFVIPTNQRNRLYLQVLEAASPSGFATLGVLGDKAGSEVPVYRVKGEMPAGSF